MIYNENQYKMLEDKLRRAEKENERKDRELSILKQENREKNKIIKDLDQFSYYSKYKTLKLENEELKKKLKTYEEKLENARISLSKDSSNSCKPSSTNGFKKVIQNNRVKTGKKPGREAGHKRSAAVVSENPDIVKKVSKVATCTCGCKTVEKEDVARDLIWIDIIVHRTQFIGKKTICPKCHKEFSPKFPKNVKSTINYDEMIKSLVVYLNSYCNLPNNKTTEFLGFLSDGKIKMCTGTVGNIMSQFSKKCQPILVKMKQEILKSPVINEDETPITVNGKIMSTIGVFTPKISLIESFKNRTLDSFKEMGILDRYIGTVCHDHNNIHKSFVQSKQAECNFHILRYCKAEYEIHKWESIKNFMDYLLKLRDKVDEYKLKGETAFSTEEYENCKKEYLRLLDEWDKEYLNKIDKEKIKYYGSVNSLKNRLREYVDDHLRFLTDFRIDFTNNLAERGLRKIKTKLKIAGGFRNLKFSRFYCDAISIIDTSKKQNMNIGKNIKNIFMGNKKIFAY